jgi:DMSO/TMAO reductase YedYZ molybdopterin-dependent catalytic subunit
MTRRELLLISGAWPLARRPLVAAEPRNVSFPLAGITGSVTPAEAFFVREHFAEPEVSLNTWKLRVEGRVARRLELSLADLIESPVQKIEAVLECAGNGPGGAAVSNAAWEGVPFSTILREAKAAPEATNILLEGADTGRLMQDSPPLPYCRLVPIVKCMRPESLVAFKMNGRFLPPANGFPARALFPGWYAMDSVKWLTRVVALGPEDAPADFLASGMDRMYTRERDGERVRLTGLAVKSAIAWPPDLSKLPAARHTIRGFAWTGDGLVRSVDVSADGGRSWASAQLEHAPRQYTWARWTFSWEASPGDYILTSRARDDAGRTQPPTRDPARKDGYELNHCAPVRCEVR